MFRMKPIILQHTVFDMNMVATYVNHVILHSIQDCPLFHTTITPERPVRMPVGRVWDILQVSIHLRCSLF
jgi:hypothetical protein